MLETRLDCFAIIVETKPGVQVTYKALEQLSETGFDLVKVEAAARRTRHSQNLENLPLPLLLPVPRPPSSCPIETVARELAGKGEEKTD